MPRKKPDQCENCFRKETELTTYYPTVLIDGKNDIDESVNQKKHVCYKCYGTLDGPRYFVSFDPIYALKNWQYIKTFKHFDHLNEKKIYAFKDNAPDTYWAFAVVTNGDWYDIREPHVREAIRLQEFPIKVNEEQLIEIAKPVYAKHAKREYPYGWLFTEAYPDSKYTQALLEQFKELLG